MTNTHTRTNEIRNLTGFIRGYAKTDHGKRLLKRQSYVDKQRNQVWRNPLLAIALVSAAHT